MSILTESDLGDWRLVVGSASANSEETALSDRWPTMRLNLIISGVDPKHQLISIECIRRVLGQKVVVFFWGLASKKSGATLLPSKRTF